MLTETRPSARPVDPHLVALQRPASFDAEQFRRLRQRIERLRIENDTRVIALTSPVPGDGKTMTALNLAAALSESPDARVLVIDADLRRPAIARTLGVTDPGGGLVAALTAPSADIRPFIRETPFDRLSILAGSESRGGSYELLASPKLAELVRQARQLYTFVIVDTAPLIPVSDTSLLAPVVDGFVVVVAARSTPRKFLGEALNLLEEANVLGLVFNKDNQSLFGYCQKSYLEYFQTPSTFGSTGGRRQNALTE